MRRALVIVLALLAGGAALAYSATRAPAQRGGDRERGRQLYAESCSDCHGADLRGIPGRGPSLAMAGPASLDFYLSTGRMPLARPGIEPVRAKPQFSRADIESLIAYVGGDGPAIPVVTPGRGSVSEGRRLFADSCSGCHQIMGRGGAAPGLTAPTLDKATPTQVGEAVRVGPYLMPQFSSKQLPPRQVDSLARYVTDVVQRPDNRGGWGIGNLGPVPEGLIAFLVAGSTILLVARIIGERLPR
jgi:ubiquinol-cytochrome c reductase cytochrome c subunit